MRSLVVVLGGKAYFVGWLTLATGYFEEHSCVIDAGHGLAISYTIGRRVLAL